MGLLACNCLGISGFFFEKVFDLKNPFLSKIFIFDKKFFVRPKFRSEKMLYQVTEKIRQKVYKKCDLSGRFGNKIILAKSATLILEIRMIFVFQNFDFKISKSLKIVINFENECS